MFSGEAVVFSEIFDKLNFYKLSFYTQSIGIKEENRRVFVFIISSHSHVTKKNTNMIPIFIKEMPRLNRRLYIAIHSRPYVRLILLGCDVF